jgi:ectoine hydroxylase-related dioxygenase (phytanoyl-CoA dioxygenase family)
VSTTGITLDAAGHFREDGYVILDQLFSEAEIAPVSDEVDRIVEGRVDYIPEKDFTWEPGANPPRVRNAFRLHLHSPFFLDVAKHPKLTGVLGDILGNPLRLYGSQVFAKPAQVGTEVPSHQDMPYWPFEPYEMLSAWIALDDSTIENGCVRMIPGSHKLGILPHDPTKVVGNSLGLRSSPEIAALPEVPIEIKRGSVVFHHCLTIHRSEPNRSNHARRGLVYVYMSPAVQLTDPSRMQGPAVFPQVS